MALNAGSIEIKLFADLARLQSDMNKANKTVDSAMNNIDKSVRVAKRAFQSLAGAFSAGMVIKMVDDYKRFDAQIKLATRGLEQYTTAYENVIRIGRVAQSDIGAIGVLYARLTNNLRDFGTSQAEIANITEAVSLSLRVSNATVQETNSVMLQLSQSFGSGRLNGQEFLAVSEGAPIIMRQLAKSIGVAYGELKEMSAQGSLTADKLAKALNDPAYLEGLRKQVKEVGTISSAFTVLQNNIKQFLGEADKANGASKAFAQGLLFLGDNLSTLATVAIGFGIVQLVKYTQSVYANLLALQEKARASIIAKQVELSLAQANYASAVAVNTKTKALANNAMATTAATSSTARLVIAETALSRATSIGAVAMARLSTIISSLGGVVGIAITAVVLFGEAIYKMVTESSPMMESLKQIVKETNDELRKTPELMVKSGQTQLEALATEREQLEKDIARLQQAEKVGLQDPVSKAERTNQLAYKQELLNASLVRYKKIIESTITPEEEARKLKQQEIKDAKTSLEQYETRSEVQAKYNKELQELNRNADIANLTDAERAEKVEALKESYKELFKKTKEQIAAEKLAKKAKDEENKAIEETIKLRKAQLEGMAEKTKATEDEVAETLRNIDVLNSSEEAVNRAELARLNEAIAMAKQGLEQAKLNGLTQEGIEFTEQAIAELENLAKARAKLNEAKITERETEERIKAEEELQKELLKQQQDAEKEKVKLFDETIRDIDQIFRRGFTQLINKGEGSWKAFTRSMYNSFKLTVADEMYKLLARPFIVKIVANLAGLTGIGEVAKGAGGIAGLAGLDGDGGLVGTLSDIGNLFSKGNQALIENIGYFGNFISGLGSSGGMLDSFGQLISANNTFIAEAVPFLDAGIKLLSGDVKGAAFSAGGAALGAKLGTITSIGGPLGTALGVVAGNLLGSMFGGKKQPPRTVNEMPDVAEVFNQSLSALLKSFGRAGEVTSSATFTGRAGGSGYGDLRATVDGMAVNDSIRYKDAYGEASMQEFITRTLTTSLTSAIKSVDIDQAFKDLFDGITDRDEMGKTIQAVVALNQNNEQLTKTLGITATQVALLANESDIAGDNLISLVNTLSGVANELFTTGDALVAIKAGIDGAFTTLTNTQVPANLKEFDEVLKSLDKTTAQGRQDFLGLISIRGTFSEFEKAISTLENNVRNAVIGIVGEAERQAMLEADLTKFFKNFNLEVPKSVEELISLRDTIDYTTAAGINLASAFPALVNAFVTTRGAVSELTEELKDLSQIAETQKQIILDLLTEENRIAQENLQQANRNADIARSNLMDSFNAERSRLEGIIDNVATLKENLATAITAEKERFQAIIDNVDTFKNALRQAFDTKATGLQETIDRFKTFGNTIREFRKGLLQSSSLINNSLNFNRARLLETAALAKTGDVTAMGELTSVANDFLKSSENYSKDFNDYQSDFLQVNKILTEVENSSFATASVADLQLKALKTQVESLISIDNNIVSVDEAIANLNEAQLQANVAQLEIERLNILQTQFLGTSNEALLSVGDSLVQLVLAESLASEAQSDLNNLNIQQISLLGEINKSVLSVADAIAGFNVARQAQASAQSVANTAQANLSQAQNISDPKLTPESIYQQFLGRSPDPEGLAYWQKQFGAEVDTNELRVFQDAVRANQAIGLEQTDEALVFAQQKFANGGAFTNGVVSTPTMFNTGLMGESGSEAIMPLTSINGRLGVTTNNSEMVKQLEIISDKISRLESAQIATAQNTGKVARIIERADNGDSLNVTVVTE